jgi:putative ATP-binding cassette transporter
MQRGLIDFLRREANQTGRTILGAALLAGLANGLIIVVINEAARDYLRLDVRTLLIFLLSVGILAVTRQYTLCRTVTIAQEALARTTLRIADKVRRAHLVAFERMGSTRVLTTLADGTQVVPEACRRVANGGVAAVMLSFSFAYLAWLSLAAFWLTVTVIACGILVYLRNQRTIDRELRVSAAMESDFVRALTHLLEGFKELKMSRTKSEELFRDRLEAVSVAVRAVRVGTEGRFVSNIIYTQLFTMIMIAAIIFALPQLSGASPQLIMSLVTVLLFIVGPIGAVVDAVPVVSVANLALERLGELEAIFERADDTVQRQTAGPLQSKTRFDAIRLQRMAFAYDTTGDEPAFSVGPIDLEVRRGEVLFLVGGNGSGKTTLLKLLAGLYYPQRGTILVDDVPVNPTNYDAYRGFFGIVLSDFHLFDRLYGLPDVDAAKLGERLDSMELRGKITYRDGAFGEITLSTGQRKRLALAVALLEDKPIYLFDEVAADQDPGFRRRFYEEILATLKAQGKTIIAVTHDDRYFHLADRVLKIDCGTIAAERTN